VIVFIHDKFRSQDENIGENHRYNEDRGNISKYNENSRGTRPHQNVLNVFLT